MNITSRGGTDVPDVKYPWMGTIWVKQSIYSALILNKKSNYNKLFEKYELLCFLHKRSGLLSIRCINF